MKIRQLTLKHFIFCAVLGLAGSVDLSFAVQKKPLDQDLSRVSPKQESKASVGASQKVLAPKGIKAADRPSIANPKAEAIRKRNITGEDPLPKKSHRAIKAHKKVIPKAVVQPRTDLIHYGILEDSQRYDPRPHADSASVPSPQTPELIHDHFQELDRNQDGIIDPVERAFGRLDMDRDLHTRTLQ